MKGSEWNMDWLGGLNSLDGAEDDLAQRIDEWFQHLTGVDGAQDSTPQVQTVHILPVIHWLIRLLLRHINTIRQATEIERDEYCLSVIW